MSRMYEGDGDEDYPNQWELWYANVLRALRGRRGQKALSELRETLVALPAKRLIEGRLANEKGEMCAVGALVCKRRVEAGEDREKVLADLALRIREEDTEDDYGHGAHVTALAGKEVGLTYALAWAIEEQNDGDFMDHKTWSPEERYTRMLAWIESELAGKRAA